jgi:hypothetical protein
MQKGEEAVKKLAEMDASLGIQDVAAVARKMRGNKDAAEPSTIPANKRRIESTDGDVLGDDSIANNLRQQALRMSAEANGLLAEAARLTKEAESLTSSTISGASIDVPTKVKKTKGKVKKVALV